MRDCLYHYTTGETLKKIIESHSLLVGSVYHMNDAKEYIYLRNPLFNEFTNRLKETREDSLLYKILHSLTNILSADRVFQCYVFCMSSEGDLLSQWRAYGSNGHGYSIGFEINGLDEKFDNVTTLDKVGYRDEQSVLKSAETIVKDITRGINNLADSPTGNSISEQIIKHHTENAIKSIESIIGFIKHDGFKDETESRLLLNSQFVLEQLSDDKAAEILCSNGVFSPRIRIHPKTGKLPIRRIYIGPLIDETNSRGLKVFLKKNGYEDVEIISSRIPYKG